MSEKKLTPEQEQYLRDYASRFGADMASKMRKVMEQNAELKEPLEVEESESESLEIIQDGSESYVKIPEGMDTKTFVKFYNSILGLIRDVEKLEVYHGLCIEVIKAKDRIVLFCDGEIVTTENSAILEELAESIPEEKRLDASEGDTIPELDAEKKLKLKERKE